jgi:hypothetical protein
MDVREGSHTAMVTDHDWRMVVPVFSVANDQAGLEKMVTVLVGVSVGVLASAMASPRWWASSSVSASAKRSPWC